MSTPLGPTAFSIFPKASLFESSATGPAIGGATSYGRKPIRFTSAPPISLRTVKDAASPQTSISQPTAIFFPQALLDAQPPNSRPRTQTPPAFCPTFAHSTLVKANSIGPSVPMQN